MPFRYTIEQDSIAIQGQKKPVRLVFGPWGAHFSPHTGHPGGNGKADMMAVIAETSLDLKSVDGQGNLVPCANYDKNQPNCGLPEEEVLARRPVYIAPDTFDEELLLELESNPEIAGYRVLSVRADRKFADLDKTPYLLYQIQWEVVLEICGYRYSIGHVDELAPELKSILANAGVKAQLNDGYAGEIGANLVESLKVPLIIEPGTEIAYPQIHAKRDPESGLVIPLVGDEKIHAQVEFGTFRYDLDTGKGYATPIYARLSSEELQEWHERLYIEMDRPQSITYGAPYAIPREWLWRAEGNLIHSPEFSPEDHHAPLRGLGTWFESTDNCAKGSTLCDEIFAINRIDRDTPAFKPEFYLPGSRYVFWHLRTGDQSGGNGFYGEVLEPSPDLNVALSGELRVRWRNFDGGAVVSYQALSFIMDPKHVVNTQDPQSPKGRIKIRWGDKAASLEDVQSPAPVTLDAPCDGMTVTCHTDFAVGKVLKDNIAGQI